MPDSSGLAAEPLLDARRRSWNLLEQAPFALLLLFTFLVSSTPIWSADIYWHVRSGQLIWEQWAVPTGDPFVYLGSGHEWIDLWWLFELLVAGAYGLGGASALSFTKAILMIAVVALGWRAAGEALPPTRRALIWLPAVVCLSARALIRPEMVTFVFLALWLLVLEGAERRPRSLWLLPASLVVWVNCQGLFAIGPILWCIFLADRFLRMRWGGRWGLSPAPAEPTATRLGFTTLLVFLACLANPYLLDGALLPFEEFGMLDWNVAEFQSPITIVRKGASGTTYAIVLLGLWLATLVSFVWLARRGRISPFRLLVFVAFSYLAASAFRNIGPFGVVAGVLLSANCNDLYLMRGERHYANAGSKTGSVRGALAGSVLLLLLCTSVVGDQWHRVWNGGFLRFGYGERPNQFSHDAVRFAGGEGFPAHAYVADLWDAAAYILHNAPERRVYFYSRGEGAGDKWKNHYKLLDQMAKADPRWIDAVHDPRQGLPVIIVPLSYRPVIAGLSRMPGWRMVHISRAVVFMDDVSADRLGLRDHQHKSP